MNKMTSKDKTLNKIEQLRVALLVVHDLIELFICVESALNECKQLLVTTIEVSDLLHELIVFRVEDKRCS